MKTALITGASSGIGAAFAEELAERHTHLVLVARSQHKLEELAQKLQEKYPIEVTIIVQDLTEEDAADRVFATVNDQGLMIDLLINNAGFGDYGNFADRPLEKQIKMIELNVMTPVKLTHLFLQGMRERQSGGIINVASIAGFQPMPYVSIYGATKAFLLSFSEAIWAENKDSGVKILVICPGPTESNFFETAEFPKAMSSQTKPSQLSTAQEVAQMGLEALEKNECVVVTGGISNQFIVNINRFLPRKLIATSMEKLFRFN